MSLNLKNPETCRLANELTALTGESLTAAVTEALRERLERVRRRDSQEERLKRMREIAMDIASRLKEPYRSIDHGEFLYDDKTGLPK